MLDLAEIWAMSEQEARDHVDELLGDGVAGRSDPAECLAAVQATIYSGGTDRLLWYFTERLSSDEEQDLVAAVNKVELERVLRAQRLIWIDDGRPVGYIVARVKELSMEDQ